MPCLDFTHPPPALTNGNPFFLPRASLVLPLGKLTWIPRLGLQTTCSYQILHTLTFFSGLIPPHSRHPGITRTIQFIREHFWWTSLVQDTREFVQACSICARGKSSHLPPAGLLRLLPIPSRPWSHIGLDFVTGLPPSEGNSVILTIVDRFSKSVHYIPLPKLPSAFETTDLLVQHVLDSTVFPSILSLTEVLSSHPWCGRNSVKRWAQQPACHRDIIRRPTARRSGQTNPWNQSSVVLPHATPPPGAHSSHGLSTPTTPSPVPLPVCPHSWLAMVTNCHCSRSRSGQWQSPQSRIISSGSRLHGMTSLRH
ncbi:uncharacterized protein LOC133488666 [Phyllopteryx taeniolatus]|uniref:uncharacterized protein LOC133488666 n=1 Tax=Phyllopteryx taeniolatus TaxID=161469 RepID=UPI002AD31B1B|nr:uncharacterized protein LOC133488666 [Phyllopteryx taeniolatus]XP_061652804.1 uncharacterized protein LOC133488666 [Phyllopteryx taeniolatus]